MVLAAGQRFLVVLSYWAAWWRWWWASFGSHHFVFEDNDRYWDLTKLRYYFDEEMCNAILAVPIDPHNHDALIWNHHHSGCFTVNSAYHLANSNFSTLGPSNPATYRRWWTTVWSSNIPPKIKHFVWKAFHHILPSNLNIFHLSPILFSRSSPPKLWCQASFPLAVIASDCQNLVHRIQKFSPDRSALSGLVAMIDPLVAFSVCCCPLHSCVYKHHSSRSAVDVLLNY
uniref:Reverse transcriptase zinc-binding domain-containing protein n=1 Tax=Cannabis sativa TaxID=3483 RepID=A0A803NVX3_CANSA